MKTIITYTLLTLLLISCKDEYTICDLPTAVRMQCGFYSSTANQTQVNAPFLTVRLLSSPDPDYTLAMISTFSLALNPVIDSIQYQISIQQASIPDTLTFVYTTQKVNVSPICGDVFINNLTKVTTTVNTLDSTQIIDRAIDTTPGENVKIYF